MLYLWQPGSKPEQYANSHFKDFISNEQSVLWLDLDCPEPELRLELESLPMLHPLSVERIFTKQPRAFLDEFDDYLHILLLEVHYNQENDVELNQCHFILGSNFLVTIHSETLSSINTVKNNTPARFFSQGTDILFYHIAQPLIETNFAVLDEIADQTENMEDRIFPKPDRQLLNELFGLKRELISIRKALAPMREVFSMLSRRENPFVDEEALPFMSLLYDQLIRLHEISDTQRDIIAGALEIYLTSLSNRMNEIMMTLTIVSTIILPLTLITGFYGMNFQHFPGISARYGLAYVTVFMILTILGMLGYFKHKKWF